MNNDTIKSFVGLLLLLFLIEFSGAQPPSSQWKHTLAFQKKKGSDPVLVRSKPTVDESIQLVYKIPPAQIQKLAKKSGDKVLSQVIIGSAPTTALEGEPALPVIPARVIIPNGYKIDTDKIKVIREGKTSISGTHYVNYGQATFPLLPGIKPRKAKPKQNIYNNDNVFPGKSFDFVCIQKKHGVSVAFINLHPITYHPKSGKIYNYGKIFLNIPLHKLRSQLKSDIKGHVARFNFRQIGADNSEVLSSYYKRSASSKSAVLGICNPLDNYQYVLVTNEAIRDATTDVTVNDLIAHKHSRGLTATIVTIEDIYANYSGVDNAEKLRNFIIDAYTNWGTEYILLGGDTNILPYRLLTADGTTIPSDLYFQCLDGTFDYDGDGIWGEPTDGLGGGEVDLTAEVYIGRASAENEVEMSNFVYKTITYENQAESSPYLRNALIVGEYLGSQFGPGEFSYARPPMEEIRFGSSAAGYTTVGFTSCASFTIDTLYDYDGTWSKTDIISKINSDTYGIINHLGHANTDYVMKFYNADADALTNNNFLFAYSQGCIPGDFAANCIAEHLTTSHRHGMFAVVFNSRYGWGAYNDSRATLDAPSQRFDRQFWHGYFGEYIFNLGAINSYSHEQNIWDINGTHIRWCYYETNLLGDPQTILRGQVTGPSLTYSFHEISDVSGGNGDGLINPGEQIEINATLVNVGSEDATSVSATLSSADSYITILDSTALFGDIPCCGVKKGALDDYIIQISPSCPTPHTATLTLSIADDDTGTWSSDFTITVYTSSQVSGYVTTLTGSNPVENGTVEYVGPLSGSVQTNASGYYMFGGIDGTYSVFVHHSDYLPSDTQEITIPPNATNINFTLSRPRIVINPTSINKTVIVGDSITVKAIVTNNGDADLTFDISATSNHASGSYMAPENNFKITSFPFTSSAVSKVENINSSNNVIKRPEFKRRVYSYIDEPIISPLDFQNILLCEHLSNGIYHYNTALDNLGLQRTFLTDIATLESELTGGTDWDLVIINLYNASISISTLDLLNEFVLNGGKLIYADWRISAYTTHDLLHTFGIEWVSNFSTPIIFNAIDTLHKVFSYPNEIYTFNPTDDQAAVDGEIVNALEGAIQLASFEGHPSSGAMVLNSNTSSSCIFNAFQSSNFNGDHDGDSKLDIIELIENEVIFLSGRSAWLSTEPSSGIVLPGDTLEIDILLNARNLFGGSYYGSLEFSHNDSLSDNPLILPCTLMVDGVRRLTVTPEIYDFGNVWVGAKDTTSLLLTNPGDEITTVTSITCDNANFSHLMSLPITVLPFGEHSIDVVFNPGSVNNESGTLTITSNAEDNPTLTVSLSGAGTPPPEIVVSPENFHETLDGGASITRIMTIDNPGGDDLGYQILISGSSLIDDSLIIAHWTFDEGIGDTAFDLSGNDNHFRLLNGVTWVNGINGNALEFDGIDDKGLCSDKPIQTGMNALTIEAIIWLETQPSGQWEPIIGKWGPGGSADDAWALDIDRNSPYGCVGVVVGSSARHIYGTVPVPLQQWTHVVFTWDGSVMSLYLDGVKVDSISGATVGPIQNSDTEIRLGHNVDPHYFNGKIDQITIYKTALSEDIISSRYRQFSLVREYTSVTWLSCSPNQGIVSPGSSEDIELVFDAANLISDTYLCSLIVTHNVPGQGTIVVPCTLDVNGFRSLAVSPENYDFGNLWVGLHDSTVITLTNTGNEATVISSIASNNSEFTHNAILPLTVPPFESVTCEAIFTPVNVGSESATLTVNSDAEDNPVLTVSLSGNGTEPPEITVNPDSFNETVSAGDSINQIINISNNGGDILSFSAHAYDSHSYGIKTPMLIPSPNKVKKENSNPDNMNTKGKVGDLPELNPDFISKSYNSSVLLVYVTSTNVNNFIIGLSSLSNVSKLDTVECETVTPNVDYLLNYNIVVVTSGGAWADPMLMGNNLAEYVDRGGKVVLLCACNCSGGSWTLNGRIMDSLYSPLPITSYTANSGTAAIFDDHPITESVTSITTSLYAYATSPQGNGISFGQYPGGYSIGAYNPDLPIVTINAYPQDSEWGGDLILMMGNTFDWMATSSWLSVSPGDSIINVLPGEEFEINISMNSIGLLGGQYLGRIDINHNAPGSINPIMVPCTLNVDGYRHLAVTPVSYDFGNQWAGVQDSTTITLINDGNEVTIVSLITSNSAEFTHDAAVPLTVQPFESVTFNAIFAPVDVGSESATITITSDAEDNPTLTIDLIGTGTTPPEIVVTPGYFHESLDAGDSVTEIMEIFNSGGDNLEFTINITTAEETLMLQTNDGMKKKLREVINEQILNDAGDVITPLEGDIKRFGSLGMGDVINSFSILCARSLTWIDDYLWTACGQTLYKINPIDGAIVDQIPISVGNPYGLTWDGNCFWVTDAYADIIYKLNATGEVIKSFPSPAPGPVGLAWDGEYLWDVDWEAVQMHKIDTSNGSAIHIIPAPASRPAGVAWDGKYLWTNGRDAGATYKVDPLTGDIITFFATPPGPGANNGQGCAFDGMYLWISNYDVNIAYQIDIEYIPTLRWLRAEPTSGIVTPSQIQNIEVTFNSNGLQTGNYLGDLNILHNAPGQVSPEIVFCTLFVDGIRKLSISPQNFDFGNVWVGAYDSTVLTLRNDGNEATNVTSIASDNSVFTHNAALPLTVPPFDEVSFDAIFSPTILGNESGIITITSDAEDNPTLTVDLAGTGTEPPQAQLEPTVLKYDLQPNDAPADQTSVLTNIGGDILSYEVASVRETSSPFPKISFKKKYSIPPIYYEQIYNSENYNHPFVPGQVVVALKQGEEAFKSADILTTIGAKDVRELAIAKSPVTKQKVYQGRKLLLIILDENSNDNIVGAIEHLRHDENVAYAQPNYIYKAIATPNDEHYALLYGMHNTGQTGGTTDADIDAPEAWDKHTGNRNILIGVIDTGIDYNHPDLAANMWINPGEIPGNSVDDDGNGFVDDVYGWDFAYDDNDPTDGHYHGTHCAGTIAGVGDNGIGVVGVMWDAQLVAIKFLDDGGSGSTADAIDAVNYAAAMNIHITSNSWGGGAFDQALKDAIAAGGLFIAAAGNSSSNNDVSPHYPSSYDCDNIIAVAATDHNDALASFSCYGLTSVDLGAPGVQIYSTSPGNTYRYLDGTSMATPHVSGAAGLVWSYNPMLTALEVKQILLDNIDTLVSLTGKCLTNGRLNAEKALAAAGPAWLSVAPIELDTLNPGEDQTFTVTVDPAGLVAGQWLGEIIIGTNDPVNSEDTIQVIANIAGCKSLVAQPGILEFDPTWAGASDTLLLSLINDCNDGVTVDSLIMTNSVFICDAVTPLLVGPFSTADITVIFTPTVSQYETGTLTIYSNADDNPILPVTLSGTGTNPPQIAVDPQSFTRRLPIGGITYDELTVSNPGGDNLTYSILGSSDATIVINEFCSNPDFLELWNRGPDQDMAGWTIDIVDNAGSTGSFNFPAGFILRNGRRVVLREYTGTPDDSTLYYGVNIGWIENSIVSIALTDNSGVGVDFVRTINSTELPPPGTNWTGGGVNFSLVDAARNTNNDTDDPMDWTNTGVHSEYLLNPGQDESGAWPPWLSASQTSGIIIPSAQDNITLTFDATDLVEGSYNGQLIIVHNAPGVNQIEIPLVLEVGDVIPGISRVIYVGPSASTTAYGSTYIMEEIIIGSPTSGNAKGNKYQIELK